MSSLISELKRRNVFRVAVLYGIVAWVLIQIVDVVMPRLGIPEWGVTLVIVLLAIGLPIALIFARAFELTPEGIKRTREVDPDTSITPDTGHKLNHLIIGILGIAVTYLLVDKFFLEDTTDPGAGTSQLQIAEMPSLISIAVLPFVDMSPDKDQEYFTDGISEELLNLLAKIRDFKVAGRTSSFAFKNKNEDLRVIGEKLGVATILEGSVRKQNDQIRVTAQLVKVDDGYHLWSDTYDRHLRPAARRCIRDPGRDRHRGRGRPETQAAGRRGQGGAGLSAQDPQHGSLYCIPARQARTVCPLDEDRGGTNLCQRVMGLRVGSRSNRPLVAEHGSRFCYSAETSNVC